MLNLVTGGLLAALRPGSVVVNHGTGLPANAVLTLLDLHTPDIVEHLSGVEALDRELFEAMMRESGVDSRSIVERGLAGAHGLPGLFRRLNP